MYEETFFICVCIYIHVRKLHVQVYARVCEGQRTSSGVDPQAVRIFGCKVSHLPGIRQEASLGG